jgi:hypothetical protein
MQGSKWLDDKWLEVYKEVMTGIRTTEDISFRLLSFVPTGAGITAGALTLLQTSELLQAPTSGFVVAALSILGFLITFGLFRWELRNIDLCIWFRKGAERLEQYALDKDHPNPPTPPSERWLERLQYRGWSSHPRPKFPELPWPWLGAGSKGNAPTEKSSQPHSAQANSQANDATQVRGWGKREAETVVYCAAMATWLVPFAAGVWSIISGDCPSHAANR